MIELMRLLAALWVVYYHNMFFIFNNGISVFNDGKISVDFFFILSGLFFIKSYNNYKDQSLINGFWAFSVKRIKAMGVALPLGLLFSTIYFIIFPTNNFGTNFIFGYLWYIPTMFLGFLFYFLVLKIKNKNLKVATIILTVISCYILFFVCNEVRIFSPFASIGLGILVSLTPNVKVLENKKAISIILSVVVIALCVYLAYLPKTTYLIDIILILVLFPAFLYLCKHYSINVPAFNYLGKLSFGLYAMQCVIRVFRDCNILTNNIVNFVLIVVLANACLLVDFLIKQKRKVN